MSATIEWLGHDSFRISNGATIYIDPWKIEGGPTADLIVITHQHFDHCEPEDVQKIVGSNTPILANEASLEMLREGGVEADLRAVKPGDSLEVAGASVDVLAAYNLNKFRNPGEPFHPKEHGHVGYKFTIAGESIYHTGDCDVMPEMSDVECDILLVPVSGTYVMTAEEAAEAAEIIKPKKYAIPMHYDDIVGTLEDAKRFEELYSGEVRILNKTA